jgi:hypothetical protein
MSSAAEASTTAATTNEKESEKKKWQQRHKARQALGCCEQRAKHKNTAYKNARSSLGHTRHTQTDRQASALVEGGKAAV